MPKLTTYSQINIGDVILFEVNGVKAERRVACIHREGSQIRLAFKGLLAQFRVYSEWRCELVPFTWPPIPKPAPVVMCAHCQERRAEWACTRLEEKYVLCPAIQMKVGDRICRMIEWHPKPNSFAVIQDIQPERHPTNYRSCLRVTILIKRMGRADREKTFVCVTEAKYRRAITAPCGVPLCENCAQDPGEPHRYCPEHWTCRTLEAAA